MQYFKNAWLKSIFIVFPLLLITVILSYSPIRDKKSENPQPDIAIRDKPEEHYDNFKVDKIFIIKRERNKMLFSLSADKAIHRKRISKLFVYQNLKEIFMSGVEIDVYPDNNASIIPIDVFCSLASSGKTTLMEDYLAGNADIDLDLLTRLLIKDLSINIHLPHGKRISFTAKGARINIDFENIVFEESVIASGSKALHASEAVWSIKLNGIYLPNGYTLRRKYHKGKAFFAITRKGEFLKSSVCPNIKYADQLEEKERVLYADLFKKMPVYVRFMFGMDMPQK